MLRGPPHGPMFACFACLLLVISFNPSLYPGLLFETNSFTVYGDEHSKHSHRLT